MKRRCLDTLALNALMKATHLLGVALGERLRQCRHSSDPALRRFARVEEQAFHVALLDEALQILGSRWNKIPERQRPHYTPEARFRILRIRSLLALSAEDTARTFRISPGTVSRWEQETHGEPERETVGSLLKPVPPIRRFADVVRHVVQDLTLAGLPGDRSVALHLARAGWTLSRRTVQRIRREKPRRLPPATQSPSTRAVRARFPNHVWMIDITELPGFLRLFSFKLAVVFDAFSRAPLSARVFLREPSGRQTARLLRHAVQSRNPPRHLVTDQGAQFTSQVFRRMVRWPRRHPSCTTPRTEQDGRRRRSFTCSPRPSWRSASGLSRGAHDRHSRGAPRASPDADRFSKRWPPCRTSHDHTESWCDIAALSLRAGPR